jgi:beta-aspartyl-peptidase (threonine type)
LPPPAIPLRPSLIVHGGATTFPRDSFSACQEGCRHALEAGWAILSRGGPAIDAVEAAIVALEDDPVFNSAYGANLNLDGYAELDAIVMDGRTLKAGAVAAVRRIRNPICLARRVLESSPHMMLVASGAEQFAVEQGMALCDPQELITVRAREVWKRCRANPPAMGGPGGAALGPAAPEHATGTVGAVAVDRDGGVVAGTSTGGTICKHAGRVGDSPLVGCGTYADAEAGGVSCTGWGEAIMKITMAKTATDLLRQPPPDGNTESFPFTVAREAIRLLGSRTGGNGGLILLDRLGRPGFAFSTPQMPHGYISANGQLVVSID